MDRNQAMAALPAEYAVALRLEDRGTEAAVIADALHIDVTAVEAVITIGRAKLAAMMDRCADAAPVVPE